VSNFRLAGSGLRIARDVPEWLQHLNVVDVFTDLLALGTLGLMVATFLLYRATACAAKDAAAAAKSSEQAADVALKQLGLARAYNEGEFLLRMDEVFHRPEFASVYARLLPVGDLGKKEEAALTDGEWTDLTPYMGALERLNLMRQMGLVRTDWLAAFYTFNFDMLIRLSDVRRRLTKNAPDWRNFIALWHELEVHSKGAHNPQGIECQECDRGRVGGVDAGAGASADGSGAAPPPAGL
jgi:hypothetical protein